MGRRLPRREPRPITAGMRAALLDLVEGPLVARDGVFPGPSGSHRPNVVGFLAARGLADRRREKVGDRLRRIVRVTPAGLDQAEACLR